MSSFDDDTFIPKNTRRSLPITLLRARESVMGRFRPLLASHGFTEQQWRALRVLGETDSLDATALAERACLLPPSLTRIIRTLEDRGLIKRQVSEGDGRRLVLSLTEQGSEILEKLGPESREIYEILERQFGKERMSHLLDILNELADLK